MNFDPVSMPKVELHCHLDGSLSKEFLMQTLQLSTLDMHTIQAPANCQSLAEYLTCFDLPGIRTAGKRAYPGCRR